MYNLIFDKLCIIIGRLAFYVNNVSTRNRLFAEILLKKFFNETLKKTSNPKILKKLAQVFIFLHEIFPYCLN